MNNLNIVINGNPILLTPPPLERDGTWLMPLESFSKSIDAKVEYPEGSGMAVLCQADRCVPLKLGDSVTDAMEIDGIMYASPAVIVELFGFLIQSQSSNQIEIVKRHFQKTEAGNIAGYLAKDFTLIDLDGVPKHLSDFRGKKALIYMWASW